MDNKRLSMMMHGILSLTSGRNAMDKKRDGCHGHFILKDAIVSGISVRFLSGLAWESSKVIQIIEQL